MRDKVLILCANTHTETIDGSENITIEKRRGKQWHAYSILFHHIFLMRSSHSTIFKVTRSLLFSHCTTIWVSFSRCCFHTARLSGYHSVAAVFRLDDGSATGGFTLHDFTIGRISNNSVCSANYSQTHTRSEGDNPRLRYIIVYKSSPNTQ